MIQICAGCLNCPFARRIRFVATWLTAEARAIPGTLGVIAIGEKRDVGAGWPSRRARRTTIDHRRRDGVDELPVVSGVTLLDGAPRFAVGHRRSDPVVLGYHGR